MAILTPLNTLFLKFVGFVLSLLLAGTAPAAATTITPKDEAGLKLQVSLLSDVHMQSFEITGFQELTKALMDINASKVKQDALVFNGDNTMNGQAFEYLMFYGLLSRYNPVKPIDTLVATGNHDYMTGLTAQAAIDRHNFFLKSYAGESSGKDYYSRVVNGYTFVMLGGERENNSVISDAQRAWLAETLAAAAPGRPIFVFMHYNINNAATLELLTRSNVFLFNGHWHTPLDVKSESGVTKVNLPALHSHEDLKYSGEGVQMEVYADRVLFRARNYFSGEWGREVEVLL